MLVGGMGVLRFRLEIAPPTPNMFQSDVQLWETNYECANYAIESVASKPIQFEWLWKHCKIRKTCSIFITFTEFADDYRKIYIYLLFKVR